MYYKFSVCVIVVLNLIVTIKCKSTASDEKGELIFAHIVSINILPKIYLIYLLLLIVCYFLQLFRHGDRMPVEPYPLDPYKDPSNWPNGFGQLTNVSIFKDINIYFLYLQKTNPIWGEVNEVEKIKFQEQLQTHVE